ncbi:PH domain-containing protein [Oceanobacillus sp. CFH 90083]|uniref:PH domain-containing protein n=1 Tax=Oceanobacillus sp. CFH 90083 TaxID=2592336 RepID=UPI00128CAB81|nr:PH domain-containing protein [Oceanobacillus sp. CFH 90083]
MVFKSKMDVWIGIFLIPSILFLLFLFIRSILLSEIITIIILSLFIFWLSSLLFHTKYIVNNQHLIIKSGFWKISIPIREIHFIRKTKNIYSAPALSIHRIEISYGTYRIIYISPESKEKFIQVLQEINPDIRTQ